jgi:hypothetical protein
MCASIHTHTTHARVIHACAGIHINSVQCSGASAGHHNSQSRHISHTAGAHNRRPAQQLRQVQLVSSFPPDTSCQLMRMLMSCQEFSLVCSLQLQGGDESLPRAQSTLAANTAARAHHQRLALTCFCTSLVSYCLCCDRASDSALAVTRQAARLTGKQLRSQGSSETVALRHCGTGRYLAAVGSHVLLLEGSQVKIVAWHPYSRWFLFHFHFVCLYKLQGLNATLCKRLAVSSCICCVGGVSTAHGVTNTHVCALLS